MTTGLLATTITLPLQEAPNHRTHYSPQLFSSKYHFASSSSSSFCLSSVVNNNRRQPVRHFYVSMCLPSSSSSSPTRLYVSGLSFRTTKESLTNAFQQFGQLVEVNLVMDRIANRPRGFAFLRYATEEESKKAIEGMHGKFLDGRVIFVEVAKPRSEVQNKRNPR